MNLNDLHRRLLRDVLEIGNAAARRDPVRTSSGLDDVIGTKMRALANRGYPRDLIDIHAAAHIRSVFELESLGHLHAWDEFSLEDLAARLEGSAYIEDEDFAGYGLTAEETARLRSWAQAWADDISRRLHTERLIEEPGADDWL